jgi:hypothetical protein
MKYFSTNFKTSGSDAKNTTTSQSYGLLTPRTPTNSTVHFLIRLRRQRQGGRERESTETWMLWVLVLVPEKFISIFFDISFETAISINQTVLYKNGALCKTSMKKSVKVGLVDEPSLLFHCIVYVITHLTVTSRLVLLLTTSCGTFECWLPLVILHLVFFLTSLGLGYLMFPYFDVPLWL